MSKNRSRQRKDHFLRCLQSVFAFCFFYFPASPAPCPGFAEAALSRGGDKQLEAASANQGGGAPASSQFKQQTSVGGSVSTIQLVSSHFRLIPGFLGAGFASTPPPPVSELTITAVHAKTEPLGTEIPPRTWQRDRDPLFYWEVPAGATDIAGYSYAVDATPDASIDTVATAFDVASSVLRVLSDAPHTFSVKAVNTAGNSGPVASFEVWVDTTAPQVTIQSPASGAILNILNPTVTAVIADVASGVNTATLHLLINGQAAGLQAGTADSTFTSTGGAWQQGTNRIELRAEDLAGNAQVPLILSIVIDTLPPTGTVTINADAQRTTSAYVTLSLNAKDENSGVASMLISNDALTGYVEEPYAVLRPLWRLNPVRGLQTVYVKFKDGAGNVSDAASDGIQLDLLSPETVITAGPASFDPQPNPTFRFMCPEGGCVFSYAFDAAAWSSWSATDSATASGLIFGNHYFRVKAAKEANGIAGIQPDEEDPSPAERTWVVGSQPAGSAIPKGPAIKLWRLE